MKFDNKKEYHILCDTVILQLMLTGHGLTSTKNYKKSFDSVVHCAVLRSL